MNHAKLFNIPLSYSPISNAEKHIVKNLRGGHRTQNFCHDNNSLLKKLTAPLAGIRAINVNPAGTFIAVASGNPYHIHIFDLPSLSSNTILQGHTDAIFSVAWIDNETIISGSRDGTMKCWKLNRNKVHTVQDTTHRSIDIIGPSWSTAELDSQRIRDLTYVDMKAVALSSNGFLDLWDVDKQSAVSLYNTTYIFFHSQLNRIHQPGQLHLFALSSGSCLLGWK